MTTELLQHQTSLVDVDEPKPRNKKSRILPKHFSIPISYAMFEDVAYRDLLMFRHHKATFAFAPSILLRPLELDRDRARTA